MALSLVQAVGPVGTVVHHNTHMKLQDQTILCQRYRNKSAIHAL